MLQYGKIAAKALYRVNLCTEELYIGLSQLSEMESMVV